jgi:hypothetical protein
MKNTLRDRSLSSFSVENKCDEKVIVKSLEYSLRMHAIKF